MKTADKNTAYQEDADPLSAAGRSRPTSKDEDLADKPSDPTYRVSKLKAANTRPVAIAPTSSLVEAVTLMLVNGFSQLPVMCGPKSVKGVVSWQSIGTRLSLGKTPSVVQDLMDPSQEIRSTSSIFETIPIIAEHDYVLVRGADNTVTGIVTSSDLNIQFQHLAEPFLLLGEIERQIRKMLSNNLSVSELAQARDPGDRGPIVASANDLSFGDYIRLLQNRTHWDKLDLPIDQKTFCGKLDEVRKIRNDVMHFDPGGIEPEVLNRLRDFARFLQLLQKMHAP